MVPFEGLRHSIPFDSETSLVLSRANYIFIPQSMEFLHFNTPYFTFFRTPKG